MSLLIANICIVPLSDEHAIYLDTGSNDIQNTSAVSVPLLSSYNRVVDSVSNILIRVPYCLIIKYIFLTLSDAVASRLPSVFNAIAAT